MGLLIRDVLLPGRSTLTRAPDDLQSSSVIMMSFGIHNSFKTSKIPFGMVGKFASGITMAHALPNPGLLLHSSICAATT